MVRLHTSQLVIICLTIIAVVVLHTHFQCKESTRRTKEHKNESNNNPKIIHNVVKKEEAADEHSDWEPHKLAVIIPFRQRFDELLEFAPWIHKFLNNQKVKHNIFVVNQVDNHRFNRASLINIGYLRSRDTCDYMVMHDVDLLPNNPELKYTFPIKGPYHLASPDIHPIYHYAKYVGGVLLLTMAHFEKCNGMSNMFWGWGREDDEFYMRMKENNYTLFRPTGITTGYSTFKHIHDKEKHPRDYKRYGSQKQVQFQRDRNTGFDTLQYKLISQNEVSIDDAPVTVINVELHCDVMKTPWCDHSST